MYGRGFRNTESFQQNLLFVEPRDELPCLEITKHTLKKYCMYRLIFQEWARFMEKKTRWTCYLDLTAGPGYSQLKVMPQELSSKQIAASPIIALKTKPEFSYLILVERELENYRALKKRITRISESRHLCIRQNDANDYVRYALMQLEGPCLVCIDPYAPTDIKWSTIEMVLENPLCDLIGLLPAPGIQRVVGAFGDRLFMEGLHGHMPPNFRWEEAETKGMLKYAMECFREWIKSLGRSINWHYIRQARYQIIFAATNPELTDSIHKKVGGYTL